MDTAIDIFKSYLQNDARFWVDIDDTVRCLIFQKFGCTYESHIQSTTERNMESSHYNTGQINE